MSSSDETASGDDRHPGEVDRLRAENARLAAENERLRSAAAHGGRSAPRPGSGPRRGRAVLSVALVVVASLLVPVSVVGVWLRTALTDTDRYVETVAPLVRNEAIRQAATDRVTAALTEGVDLETRVADVLPPDAAFLAAPLTAGITNVTRGVVERVIGSEQFAGLWDEANRLAHDQVVGVLTNRSGEAGVVRIDLTDVAADAGRRLGDLGLTFLDDAQRRPVTLTLVESPEIARVQTAFRIFDTLAPILPWATMALYVAAVVAADDRRRATLRIGIGVMVGALVLLVALGMARTVYLGSLPPGASVPANEAIFDTLTRFLGGGGRTVLAIGLVLVAAALLAGPGAGAARIRRSVAGLLDGAGREAGRRGVDLGPVGPFVARNRTAFRLGVIACGVVALLVVGRPSGGTVLWIAVLTAGGLGLVELVARTAEFSGESNASGAGPQPDAPPAPAGSRETGHP